MGSVDPGRSYQARAQNQNASPIFSLRDLFGCPIWKRSRPGSWLPWQTSGKLTGSMLVLLPRALLG
ncbi:hypothetical protein KQX54_000849, partial [Cotesia glomerata]